MLEIDGKAYGESTAICRYLAIEAGLSGKTPIENLQIDQMAGAIMDLWSEATKLWKLENEGNMEAAKTFKQTLMNDTIPYYFSKFELILRDNGYIANGKMSLIPLLSNLLDEYRRPTLAELYDQHFGLGLLNDEVLSPSTSLLPLALRSGYLRPWRNLAASESGVSAFQSDKNELRINLDVQQFKPEELKVRIAEGFIVVEGKHEERSDQHGFISRQFTRRYKIPEDVDETTIVSSLSSDGVLTLKAPKKQALAQGEGRDIPITQTNQPAVKSKPEGEKTEQ